MRTLDTPGLAPRVLALVALAAGFAFIHFGLFGLPELEDAVVDRSLALPVSEETIARN
jgi:hypothetical protein